ncbi:unnamed protein product, partial [Staurois parvus]
PPPLSTPHCQYPSTLRQPLPPIPGLHSVSSTPLCQSLHWLPLSVLHPLSANPSTGLHSVSSTPLCQSLHWLPLSVLHPSLPIPPLASIQCPPPLSANPSTGIHPSLPIPPLASTQCPPPLS